MNENTTGQRFFRSGRGPAVLTATAVFVLSWLAVSADVSDSRPSGEVGNLISLLRVNSFREAAGAAEEILAGHPGAAETQGFCGLALLKIGRIDEAEEIFDGVLARDPGNPEAHLGLGRIARIRNDAATAMAHLRRAVNSEFFHEEALHQLWRVARERGRNPDLEDARRLTLGRFQREGGTLPRWAANSISELDRLAGKDIFEMEGDFEHIPVPLLRRGNGRTRMVSLRLNGKGEYPFHLDSASPDFLTVSPLLAEELGLEASGSSTAVGVGTGTARVQFSTIERVDLGPVTFRNVPVMVSDLHTFRGLKTGLAGTGFLKRFNCTIDVRRETMDLFPLDRPDLLEANIAPGARAVAVPLYIFDATTVEAAVAGGPSGLFILDSAASTNLIDDEFFGEHLKPIVDPSLIRAGRIQGAQGTQNVNFIDGLSIRLGELTFEGQRMCEFPMDSLNEITGRYAAGLVGNPLLWPYRVHFDFRGGRLILERHRE